MVPSPSLCQVAFSATDLERTHAWYRELFGFLPSGGTTVSVSGPLSDGLASSSPQAARVGLTERQAREQGLPYVASTYRYCDTA